MSLSELLAAGGTSSVDPDSYALVAADAKAQLGSGPLSAQLDQALATQAEEETLSDRALLAQAQPWLALSSQVQASLGQLGELDAFLSSFQADLSSVSHHISHLQQRSLLLSARLDARRHLEAALSPFLQELAIPPQLIHALFDEPVNATTWPGYITQLDTSLRAIRSGPRVQARADLDKLAETLRVLCAGKIEAYLLDLLRPYGLSVADLTPLSMLQSAKLLPVQPLFLFLLRHAPRQAHGVQKNYEQTVRWYYETGFRRYVRALEKCRLRGKLDEGLLAEGADDAANDEAIEMSKRKGSGVIPAFMANQRGFSPSKPALFRSLLLVLHSNASSEHSFLATFFSSSGQSSASSGGALRTGSPLIAGSETASVYAGTAHGGGGADTSFGTSAFFHSELGGGTTIGGGGKGGVSVLGSDAGDDEERGERERRKREVAGRKAVDGLWKAVMEPAEEYTRNFIHALLPQSTPSTLLASLRLLSSLSADAPLAFQRSFLHPLWETLLRALQGAITEQVGKLRALREGGRARDEKVRRVAGRYVVEAARCATLLLRPEREGTADLEGGDEDDDEQPQAEPAELLPQFGEWWHPLREEMSTLILAQGGKIKSPTDASKFVRAVVEGEIVLPLEEGPRPAEGRGLGITATNVKSGEFAMREVAFWKEVLRKHAP